LKPNLSQRQSGITLLEVLIAVLVLAIGLLGIAGLQTSALTNNFVSYQYTQAAILTQSMVERMRANRLGVIGSAGTSYYALSAGSAPAPSVNCSNGGCTNPSDQAKWDMAVWYNEVTGGSVSNAPQLDPTNSGTTTTATSTLPNSATSIMCCPGASACPKDAATSIQFCTIAVYWDPNRTAGSSPTYTCNPSVTSDLRCFQLGFTP
jgi:type IV pilus assembly protein PilV